MTSVNDSTDEYSAPGSDFDAKATAEMLGLSARQLAFALARVKGMNRTQAARAAGYEGSDAHIRSSGSQTDKSEKVRRFLQLAAVHGAGEPVLDITDLAGVKRNLNRLAKSTGASAVTASKELAAIIQHEQTTRRVETPDPITMLENITSRFGPAGCFLAMAVARDAKLLWQPKGVPVPSYADYCALIEPALRLIARKENTEIYGVVATPKSVAAVTKRPAVPMPDVPLSNADWFQYKTDDLNDGVRHGPPPESVEPGHSAALGDTRGPAGSTSPAGSQQFPPFDAFSKDGRRQ